MGAHEQYRTVLCRRETVHPPREDSRYVPGPLPEGAGKASSWRSDGPEDDAWAAVHKGSARSSPEAERGCGSGRREGALGGKRVDRPGYFLETTILIGIKPDNPAYYQEFFAPVALVFRVKDEKEAIKLANDSPYGLGGSVITKDIERGKRVARQIETGMVFINKATWTAPNPPFGGVKNSGYGRELSDLGIGEFVNKKLIRVA